MGLNNFTNPNSTNNGGNNKNPLNGVSSHAGNGANNNASDYDAMDFLIDYNKKFQTAGKTMFRDEIVEQTLAVLIGKNKPNALLIGSAGVGKTKIVEDLAFRLATNDGIVPDTLKGFTIYELPLSNIVSGSSFVGQLEEKLKSVIDFAEDKKNKAILFIDEIHMIVSDNQIYSKMAEILKPALARGEMRVIGATTLQESQDLIDNPAFNRRFSRLIVDELSREQTVEILKSMKGSFFTHYGNKITIDDAMLETVAVLADEFHAAGNHRPDTAITLLDRTIGDAIVARKVMEESAKNDPALLAAIQSVTLIPITEKQLRTTAVKLATGNNKKADLDVDALKADLSVIKGQDEIIDTLVERIRRNDMNLFPKVKPLTILFAGTSGVGKTEVTKIIAKEITGVKPITLNMTEFHSPASINRIIGAPAGYVGSDSKAELPFDCLESNPYQVILLDEFEKCDKSVQRLFMSAFDEGYIKTNKGKIVDFSKAIIIATTNAAHKDHKNSLGFTQGETKSSNKSEIKDLSQWFDTELLNRFDTIVTFNELSKDIYREIIADTYHREAERILSENKKIKLAPDMPDADLDKIVEDTYIPSFGARPAGKAVRQYIEDHA
jgi:ATP-dependent Clp protease ATP-binding subunit ClpB